MDNEDIEIEIRYEDEEACIVTNSAAPAKTADQYEAELHEVAKYLVDEITKISLNKVKIDALNATLDKKYSMTGRGDEPPKNELLTSLADMLPATSEVKSREQLLNYYTKLESNLEQVRSEIEQLKREAFEDMAYINQILGAEEQEQMLLQQKQQQDASFNNDGEKDEDDEEEQ
jgi:antitoxin component HigA of HigAB toxin-antitoxin module